MDFDADRLLKLSGISSGESESVLTEGVAPRSGVAEPAVLSEASLRTMIREELAEIFEAMEEKQKEGNTSADWIYGKKKPTQSRTGRVTRGFRGVGFTHGD